MVFDSFRSVFGTMCGTVFYSSLLNWSSLILKFDSDMYSSNVSKTGTNT